MREAHVGFRSEQSQHVWFSGRSITSFSRCFKSSLTVIVTTTICRRWRRKRYPALARADYMSGSAKIGNNGGCVCWAWWCTHGCSIALPPVCVTEGEDVAKHHNSKAFNKCIMADMWEVYYVV